MCRKEIDQELSKQNVHILNLTYEEFCNYPLHSIDRVCNAIEELGYTVKPLHSQIIPLQQSKEIDLPKAVHARLRDAITTIFSE